MANGEVGRCPDEYEREALLLVVKARRKDELKRRLGDFLRGLKDDENSTGDDIGVISDLIRAHIMSDKGPEEKQRRDYL